MHNSDQEPLIIADLSKCQPQGAIFSCPDRCTWQAVAYETEEISGVMLTAEPDWIVPEVHYPLAVNGWHAVYLGLWKGRVTVQLSSDGADRYLRPDHAGTAPVRFQEVLWKCADLTGQHLTFKHVPTLLQPVPPFGNSGCSCIAYVKLVPLSSCEVEQLHSQRTEKTTKRLIGHNDFATPQGKNRSFTTIEKTRDQIEPYLNTDFEKLFLEYWHTGEVTCVQMAPSNMRERRCARGVNDGPTPPFPKHSSRK